eukprot:GFYU01011983.1.p1 GENE.GFYU01011983.1~~GFYU01011983.1.p1  ORF type:complete len:490 (-),score=156.85 GFYU01011983.1:62-1465(-)
MMSISKITTVAILALSCISLVAAASFDGLVNNDVQRKIDISSQFVKESASIEVHNSDSKSASKYYVAVPTDINDKLSYITAESDAGKSLVVKAASKESTKDFAMYEVRLPSTLQGGKTVTITVNMVYTHLLEPFPVEITQAESQLVVYTGNHYFNTPYETKSQTTEVELGSSTIESSSELEPYEVKSDSIEYGPYEDVKGFSVDAMRVHYENNFPFATISEFLKEIEVSHWGNIAVEEHYTLRHTGAKLKGTFSRLEYQRNPVAAGVSSFASLKSKLPPLAANLYYRDVIGNISTSNAWPTSEAVELEIRPRFPLFGGWKTEFYMGYNLPASAGLGFSADGKYVLNMKFSTDFEDVVVDSQTLKVILPEGANTIEFHAPFDVDSKDFETRVTYLDTDGRPVLVVTKNNLVDFHNVNFQVTYNTTPGSMFREPFLLISAFFTLFVAAMIYSRMEFSLSVNKPAVATEE